MSEPASSGAPRLSFVVPAFDEERRLGVSLARLVEFAGGLPCPTEIIVVDDGSSDRTADTAREALDDLPANVSGRFLRHETNRGKGAAVRTGMLVAQGEYVFYLDADLATPPEESIKLIAELESGADVAAGSRVHPSGVDMRASQPWPRRLAGKLFALLRKRLLLSDVEDTQCGFKGFRREAAQVLFRKQQLVRWSFDAELLFLASQLGYDVRQVPVEWRHMEDSRFRIGLRDAVREIRDLVSIRWRHRNVGA